MPNTMTLISGVTVGAGGAANISFSSIPNTYTDLVLKISGRTNTSGGTAFVNCSIAINGSTSNFTNTFLYGSGSGVGAAGRTDNLNMAFANAPAATTSTFSNEEFYFMNYKDSANKAFFIDKVAENNGTEGYQHLNTALWSSSAAIESITITPQSGSYVQYSTAYLYGIKNS